MPTRLTVDNHDRDSAALTYVYPVISRRAGGVSVGINLNPNNACNWRCLYCQVPNLVRGSGPEIDLLLLEQELSGFLDELLSGSFMLDRVPPEMRRINDIALSGNGEPSSCRQFLEVVQLIARLRQQRQLSPEIKTVLISNGSLLYRPEVQQALSLLAEINGELWFKLDRMSEAGFQQINDIRISLDKVKHHLQLACEHVPTWLQTCWFSVDGEAPSKQDEDDYLALLQQTLTWPSSPKGVLLYGLARPSMQPEANRLSNVTPDQLLAFAERIKQTGLLVKVSS